MNDALRRMARGGKTFHFASRWLDNQVRLDAAAAYSFCRTVDDIADVVPTGAARSDALREILESIAQRDARNPATSGVIELIERFPEIQGPVELLVTSCLADTHGIRTANLQELLRYCHGVAGTVGLIMYPILGGTDPKGREFAAALGIAMQCTNIARDVLEDLENDRIYLPAEWIAGVDLSALRTPDCDAHTEATVVAAVRRLLSVASEYYDRGLSGLHYLHPSTRFAIRVAATCYGAIGSRVIRDGKLSRSRAIVPLHQKLLLAVKALRRYPQGEGRAVYQGAQ